MGEEVPFSEKVSAFNESFQQLTRLHDLWSACNKYSGMGGSLEKWKWTLDAVWRELSPDAFRLDTNNKNETETWKYKIKVIANKDIAEAKIPTALYFALSEKEELLRLLLNASGKGTLLKDSIEDEFN